MFRTEKIFKRPRKKIISYQIKFLTHDPTENI